MEALTQLPKIDGDRTRGAILKAAEELFVEQGFAATSMATLAKRAGVTKSLIHHHFGSKRELWDAVKAEVMEEYGRQQAQLITERAPDLSLVEDSLVIYFRFLQRNPHVVRLWTWMVIERDEQCMDLVRGLTSAGVAVLGAAQTRGEIRADIDPRYILGQFFSLVRGWFMERAILRSTILQDTSDELADENYLRSIVKTFVDGIRAR
jgi:TetR/AcrR family transcriptional regulator